MEKLMTAEEYKLTIKRLVKLMNAPKVDGESKIEMTQLLDRLDTYNGMEFLKVAK